MGVHIYWESIRSTLWKDGSIFELHSPKETIASKFPFSTIKLICNYTSKFRRFFEKGTPHMQNQWVLQDISTLKPTSKLIFFTMTNLVDNGRIIDTNI